MTNSQALPEVVALKDFFNTAQTMLARYVDILSKIGDPEDSHFPRVLTIVKLPDRGWGISRLQPAHPDFLPKGMLSVHAMLREPYEDLMTVNVFIAKASKPGKPPLSAILLGNVEGGVMTVLRHNEEWKVVKDETMGDLLRYQGQAAGDDTSGYAPTQARMAEILGEALHQPNPDPAVLAQRCMEQALRFAQGPASVLLDESHAGLRAVAEALEIKADALGGALQRGLKAQDKQYQKLFKDYEKVQVQAQGYKARIARLEEERKKWGTRKISPVMAGSTDLQTLAQRLATLF